MFISYPSIAFSAPQCKPPAEENCRKLFSSAFVIAAHSVEPLGFGNIRQILSWHWCDVYMLMTRLGSAILLRISEQTAFEILSSSNILFLCGIFFSLNFPLAGFSSQKWQHLNALTKLYHFRRCEPCMSHVYLLIANEKLTMIMIHTSSLAPNTKKKQTTTNKNTSVPLRIHQSLSLAEI